MNEAEFRSAKLGCHGAQRSRSTNPLSESWDGEDGRCRAALSIAAVHGPQEAHRKLAPRKLHIPPYRRQPAHNTASNRVQTATMARKSVIDASAIASSTTDFTMTVVPF